MSFFFQKTTHLLRMNSKIFKKKLNNKITVKFRTQAYLFLNFHKRLMILSLFFCTFTPQSYKNGLLASPCLFGCMQLETPEWIFMQFDTVEFYHNLSLLLN
jgi:hypothetical protein